MRGAMEEADVSVQWTPAFSFLRQKVRLKLVQLVNFTLYEFHHNKNN